MTSGVYKVLNVLDGEFYVGSSKDIYKRWLAHLREQRNQVDGKKVSCPLLYEAMSRDGVENFKWELIEQCAPVRALLLDREQHYLDTLHPAYNRALTAKGLPPNVGNKDFRHTEETKQRQSEIHKALRAQKKAERGAYITPAGLESMRIKREAFLTPERRAQFAVETEAARALAHEAFAEKADNFARQFYPIIVELQETGLNFIEIAAELNARGYKSPRGVDWIDNTVAHLIKRYKKLKSIPLGESQRFQGNRAMRKNVDEFVQKFFPMINEMKERGLNMSQIADKLNAEGHLSNRGKAWTYQNVGLVLKRMKELMPEKETPPEVHKLQNEVFGQNQPQSKPVPHEPETRFLGWNAVVSRR